MEGLVLALAVLACPLGMGLCMWLMSRGMGHRSTDGQPTKTPSVAELRIERDRLESEIASADREAGGAVEAKPAASAPLSERPVNPA